MLLPLATGLVLGLCVWWMYRILAQRAANDFTDGRHELDLLFVDRNVTSTETQLRKLAGAIGRDLANSSTAVQSQAQLLCEAVDEPALITHRCEELWTGVDRLRLLADKILTFATDQNLVVLPVDLRTFIESTCQEIEERHGNGLDIQHSTAAFLPPARTHRRSLRNALHFLVDTLLDLEPNARCLSIATYEQPSEEDDPRHITIELCVEVHEWIARNRQRARDTFTQNQMPLGYLAACKALEAQNASLSIRQTKGLSATAFVSLEVALNAEQSNRESDAATTGARHAFGGVLVLDRDEAIRSTLTDEIERLGRTTLNSVDATAARSLLEATPERFELLVLELDAPHGGAAEVLRFAREHLPDCKVMLLVSATQEVAATDQGRAALEAHPDFLCKPYGILELRAALSKRLSILPASPAQTGSTPRI